jgi:ATP-binding cassette, subfamily B, multidrug efflux pump
MLFGNETATEDEIKDALVKAQAWEIVEKKGGLDATVEQNGRNFSGGQKQRLTIARALVKGGGILILDDSSSALDFKTDAELRKAVKTLGDRTVFIVSQRISSVRNADEILVLDRGELVGKGTHDELMESNEIYQDIYYSQFPEERKEVKA